MHDLDDVLKSRGIDRTKLLPGVARDLQQQLNAQFRELAIEECADDIVDEDVRDDAKIEQLGEQDEQVGGFLATVVVFGCGVAVVRSGCGGRG